MANTNSTPKMTKAQKFNILLTLSEVKSNPMLTEFIEHEIELLSKKNSSEKKPTKTQVENEVIKTAIVNGMEANRRYTITELVKEIPKCNELTGQKVSALVRQLITEGKVAREADNRKALFYKIAE